MKFTIQSDFQGHAIAYPIFSDRDDYPFLQVAQYQEDELFKGALSEVLSLVSPSDQPRIRILLGLGESSTIDHHQLRKAFSTLVKEAHRTKVKHLGIKCSDKEIAKVAVEAIQMANYSFSNYKTKKEAYQGLEAVTFISDQPFEIEKEVLLGKAVTIARDLVNEPANHMTPSRLGQEAVKLGQSYGFQVKVLQGKALMEEKMHAFQAVSQGSSQAPVLIVMEYQGNPQGQKTIGLVGKGLTYDAGGYSIKPSDSMINMKSDMGGAAAVLGAMCAIAGNKLKENVVSVIASCENMISGASYKPGDIISSRAGKSIFIGNTDAEGRLTLIDAMDYLLTNYQVDRLIDIATLTGASIAALGSDLVAALGNDDQFFEALHRAAAKADEPVWRMPAHEPYKELLRHHEADLTNAPGRPGMITAGLFLGEFVKDTPWIHLDIAGTSFTSKAKDDKTKGATGVGVRLLYHVVQEGSL